MATPGALFELVARGVKDTYISTTGENSGSYINPYTQVKDPVQPIIKETRLAQAKSLQPIEFDVDIFGDIIESLRFKVTFPSWLPSELPIQTNQYVNSDFINKLYTITDSSGVSYSLTPYAAYFLFKKISIYQDNQIIYSIDGDGLFALDRENSESLNSFWLHNKTAGSTGKDRQFWVNIPFPGTQSAKGFPICAMYGGQQFRIRCELRNINELITNSQGNTVQPWNKQLHYTMTDSTIHTFQSAPLQPILVELENTQLYIDNDARDIYARMTHNIVFQSPFTNTSEIIQQDYDPLTRGSPEAIITRQIDGRHPSSEVIIMTRPKLLLQNNQYVPTLSGFYTSVRMTIAGQEREALQSETVLGTLTNLIKKSIYRTEEGIIRYNWTVSGPNQVGTINFTTASKATLHFSLSPTLPSQYIKSGLIQNIYVLGWGIYQIKDGRGKLVYYN